MTRIKYSALVNTIRGRLDGNVLSSCRGVNYLKQHNYKPHQPRSADQQNIRGILNNLSGQWYSLSQAQKKLWNEFAFTQHRPMTGLNAFNSLNLALIKYLSPTAQILSPPPYPSTPPTLKGLNIAPLGNGNFCIYWTLPTLTTIYIIAAYWAMPGRQDAATQRWSFGCSSGANSLYCTIATNLPDGCIVHFRARTMDTYGRLSPWSHITKSAVPQAGIYGNTAYGWSYYGPAA